MAEWFREWFNTDEYLYVYRNRNEQDAKKLVELIIKNVNLPENSRVLDLACGAGRHSVLFAQKGFKVTAVDLSENLLKVARLSAKEANVNINFVQADIRHFCINKKFDLIANLFTSFGYFDDDKENFLLFDTVQELLNKNGSFALDYFNPIYIRKNLVKKSEEPFNGGKIIQEREIVGSRVIKRIKIIKDGKVKNFIENVRMYSLDEIENEIKKRGMKIKHIYGNSNGDSFAAEKSKRIILIAQK
jgi:cyclopropane fatty-acyl-phospholipid synthase-like methyltransferase